MQRTSEEKFDIVSNYNKVFSDEFYNDYVQNFVPSTKKKYLYRFTKRVLDMLFSALAIIVLLPIFLIISIAIKIDSKGPVIFVQKRMGKGNKPFNCYKFRTMMRDAPHDTATSLLKDAGKYYTRVGRFLRKTSLDELPQLFDILLGKMSFIGYRPLVLTEENCNDMRNKMNVFSMRPGISGWAQVNGRNDVYYKNKAIMDAEYVKKASLWLDVKILFKSVTVVFSGRGNADN